MFYHLLLSLLLGSAFAVPCGMDDIHLAALPPKEWVLPLSNGTSVLWAAGFCAQVGSSQVTHQPCSGRGYMQMFTGDVCGADFTEWMGLETNESGIILNLATKPVGTQHQEMKLYLACDPSARQGSVSVHHTDPSVRREVTGDVTHYYFNAKSPCTLR
eukprot:NODE_6733_length_505_cov_8.198413_g6567_i0.p1 GENE.NODE_6733_length_505_cov_8.198413_g6567_i0~~NODE_6733_length_505_cov_8.198413_g6567_i0.p1  ORF type:complete len:167 (+),score=51.48 NODE_6733_length_505_cov_8.198413_g6567_i0:30-503(+)